MNGRKVVLAVIVAAAAFVLTLTAAAPAHGGPPGPGERPADNPGTAVSSAFLYQGRLTDGSGAPIPDGQHRLTFKLYSTSTYPFVPTSTVTVTTYNGLFTAPVDFSASGYEFNGEGVSIALTVEGWPEFSAQEIYPVPYALTLRPGAYVYSGANAPVLRLLNNGYINSGETGFGLNVTAWGDAIHGDSYNNSGVRGASGCTGANCAHTGAAPSGVLGIGAGSATGVDAFSADGISLDATGTGTIRSAALSYWWISGNDIQKQWITDTTRWDLWGSGSAAIYAGGTLGPRWVFLPVSIPGMLFGQSVSVEQVAVYYKCQNGAQNYITQTRLRKQTSAADDSVGLIDDWTTRSSDTASAYGLTITSAERRLTASQGILGLHIRILFNNNSDYVMIGGARLTLSHR